jgi:hypothetical protein
MDSMEGLRIGMFLASLVMAAVPVSLAVGVVIFVIRQRREGGPP